MPAPKGNQYAKGNKGGGRPSDYDPENHVKLAKAMSRLGATDLEIADEIGVNIVTFYSWRSKHKEFSQATRVGKEYADDRVAKSFYNRAVGYSFDSEKIMSVGGKVVRVKYREHVPPDSGAAIKWLQNRRPDEWREKAEIDHKHTFTLEQIVRRSYELEGRLEIVPLKDGIE